MFNKHYKIILAFCFFNLIHSLNYQAQINKGDLVNHSQDTNLVNHLNSEVLKVKNSNPHKAISLCQKSSQLASTLNFKRGLSTSLIYLIEIYNVLAENDSAEMTINILNDLSKNFHSKLINARLFTFKGQLSANKNKLDSAMFYFLKSLKICTDLKDTNRMVGLLSKLADINSQLKLIKESDNFLQQASSFIQYVNDSNVKANYYYIKSVCASDKENFDSAKIYMYTALRMCAGDNLVLKDQILNNLGSIYIKDYNDDSALVYLRKAYTSAKSLNLKNRLLYASINIASLLYETNQLKEAEILALETLPLSKKRRNHDPTFVLLNVLSEIYIKKNNYEQALKYYKEAVMYNDSIQQHNNRKQVLDISTRYETEKKDAQIALLNKDKELSIKETQKQRYIKIFISSVALFLLVLAGFLFYNFRQKNKSNKLLSLQKQQIELKNGQLEIQKNNIELQNTLLENKNQLITDSIEYARKIQDSILPDKTILFNYFSDAFIYYQPKDIVSGDFYWLKESETGILVALADCTGHGVPGALMSVLGHNSLDSAYSQLKDLSPANVLRYLDGYMKQKTHHSINESDTVDGMALSLINYNKNTHKIHYTTANHYIYIIRNNELIELKGNRFSIGSWQTQEIVEGALQLEKNDMLYLFSDGYADQKGEEQKRKFMYALLKELLLQIANLSGKEQHLALKTTMDKWKGNLAQIDDILVLGIRV